jgi:hypothetical protein
VKRFVDKPDFPWRNKFAGLTPGSDDFTRQWKKIAADEPERFQSVQHEFIKQTHFDPLVTNVKDESNLDLTTRSPAVQDVIWSTAVQHGPNTSIVDRVLTNLKGNGIDPSTPNFDERLIKAIYDERGRKLPNGDLAHFSRNSKDVQKGVANRFVHEKSDALQMLVNES